MSVRYTFYEFFAGAGLARLGLEDGWDCLWANDFDPKKAEVYRHNFPNCNFTDGDIAHVKAVSLPGKADMAWASFPCQDLSLAGWRRGMSGERSGTFWAFWRIMKELHDQGRRPPLVVLENVVGLLYGDGFSGLCEALVSLGMQFGAVVMDAKQFVPQSRPRVFVVALDWGLDVSDYCLHSPDRSPWVTQALRRAHDGLPESVRDLWRWWNIPASPCADLQTVDELINDKPEGITWHSEMETQHLLDMMSPAHIDLIRRLIATGGRHVGMLYRRTREGRQRAEVRFDGVAGCLRTPHGGSSRQTVVVVDAGRVRSRLLSPREAARLMGIKDQRGYWLPANYNDAYKAMGDAVVVPVVSWLSEKLLLPLAEMCRASLEVTTSRPDPRIAAHIARVEELAAKWGGLLHDAQAR